MFVMYALIQSFLLVLVSVLFPMFVGLTFVGIIRKKFLRDKDFCLAFFVGITVIVLLLQNFVYLNVPVKTGIIPLFVFVGLAFLYLLSKKRICVRKEMFYVIFGVGAVLFVNAIGYFRETARWYVGYGWQDQYNYTVTAEFLKGYPYKTNFEEIDTPYIVQAIAKKSDRIGQSVYHAFLSSVTNLPANYIYGSVSLLAPILTFFAFLYLLLSLRVKKIFAYLFSYVAAVVPATSVIHLENFLSQALGTPFLIMTIVYVLFIGKRDRKLRNIFVLGLLVAGTNIFYAEYTPFILLVIFLKIVYDSIFLKKFLNNILNFSLALILSFLLNLGFIGATFKIFKRTNLSGILSHVYPFNYTVYGYNRFFFGDLDVTNNIKFFYVIVFILLLGIVGFLFLVWKKKSFIWFIFLAFPLVSILLNLFVRNYSYQTYKLMLSFLPLLLVGIAYLMNFFCIKKHIYLLIFLLPLIFIPTYSTLKLSNMAYLGGGRSIKPIVNSTEHRKIYDHLEQMRGGNIFLDTTHPYELARMVYYGRNNNLWFLNNVVGDFDTKAVSAFSFTDVTQVPKDAVRVRGIMSFPIVDGKKNIFAIIDGSIEGLRGNLWTWLGEKMSMKVYSDKKQLVGFSFDANSGPANKDRKRVVRISNLETGDFEEIEFVEAIIGAKFNFLLNEGFNNFEIETVYPEEIEFIPENDKRVFMVMIRNLTLN